MIGVNKVILIGQVIQDVTVRVTSSNKRIAETLLAIPHRFKDKITGEFRDTIQYIKIKFFNDMASKAQVVIKKNKELYIEGFIQSTFNVKNFDHYQMEIIVKEFKVLYNKDNTPHAIPGNPVALRGDDIHDENEWAGNQ